MDKKTSDCDPFNPENLRIKENPDQNDHPQKKAVKANPREERWARVPLEWAGHIAKKVLYSAEQQHVFECLIYWTTFAHGDPIAATAAHTGNMSRRAVRRTLELLEAAGAAEVIWRSKKCPTVRLKINQ